MHKLCRVDLTRSQEIFEKIKKYTEAVVQALDPQAVILFGSFARGDINEGSDVDICVVADFREGFLDRIKILLELNEGLPLEPIGYTPEEFKRMEEQRNPFILEIKREGKVLYGSISYFQISQCDGGPGRRRGTEDGGPVSMALVPGLQSFQFSDCLSVCSTGAIDPSALDRCVAGQFSGSGSQQNDCAGGVGAPRDFRDIYTPLPEWADDPAGMLGALEASPAALGRGYG
jgi:predicted nucleotidyltransferase